MISLHTPNFLAIPVYGLNCVLRSKLEAHVVLVAMTGMLK